jgi:DNA-binding response OmpR family regulator
MRVLLLGDNTSIQRLVGTAISGLDLISASEIDEAIGLLNRNPVDMVMVSSTKENAGDCCDWFMEHTQVPVALIVRDKDTNWREVSRFGVDGFIPDNSSVEELRARLYAISRRLKSSRFQGDHSSR